MRRGYYFYEQVSRAGQPGMAVARTQAMDSEIALIAFAGNPDAFIVVNIGASRKVKVLVIGTPATVFSAWRITGDAAGLYRSLGRFEIRDGVVLCDAPAGSVPTFFWRDSGGRKERARVRSSRAWSSGGISRNGLPEFEDCRYYPRHMVHLKSEDELEQFVHGRIREVGLPASVTQYFDLHRQRLWASLCFFGLLDRRFDHLLEIGPGVAFLPFLWREGIAASLSTFEGDTASLRELGRHYEAIGAKTSYGNLFNLFGDPDRDPMRLPFEDDQFDAVICWETMEHFNFNPVPFLRDLRRVVRPGGRLLLTVPNQAKMDLRLKLLFGCSVRTPIPHYFGEIEDPQHMKYAPHWREYTLSEMMELVIGCGFKVENAGYRLTFELGKHLGIRRKIIRRLGSLLNRMIPSGGTICLVEASKPC